MQRAGHSAQRTVTRGDHTSEQQWRHEGPHLLMPWRWQPGSKFTSKVICLQLIPWTTPCQREEASWTEPFPRMLWTGENYKSQHAIVIQSQSHCPSQQGTGGFRLHPLRWSYPQARPTTVTLAPPLNRPRPFSAPPIS